MAGLGNSQTLTDCPGIRLQTYTLKHGCLYTHLLTRQILHQMTRRCTCQLFQGIAVCRLANHHQWGSGVFVKWKTSRSPVPVCTFRQYGGLYKDKAIRKPRKNARKHVVSCHLDKERPECLLKAGCPYWWIKSRPRMETYI